MRYLSIALVASLGLFVAACGDDDDSSSGSGAGSGGMAGETATDDGGEPSRGGSVATHNGDFTDLPGKIRFVNFVSDGTDGVNLDLYWGTSLAQSERVMTVEYGQVTEFLTPRHLVSPVLQADEARFFLVPEGDVSGTASSFLVQDNPKFAADTVLTIGLAGHDGTGTQMPYVVAEQIFYEAELTTPPAGMAHVFGWSSAFDSIKDGKFVLVGANDLCEPDQGEPGGANLGVPAIVPDGATGLTLFDANTECATGATPVTESVEAGHSYVLLGQADAYELDARRSVLLEVGTEN